MARAESHSITPLQGASRLEQAAFSSKASPFHGGLRAPRGMPIFVSSAYSWRELDALAS